MALPVLNNTAAVDASTIQQTVLNAAAKTGKLQITNNGAINFTNYVQGQQQTATKESSNFFSDAASRTLGEIKNLLTALNNNIGRFIQTANIEKSVAANLAEAATPKDYDRESSYKLTDLRDDFKTIIYSLGEKISYNKQNQTGSGFGIGGIGGLGGFAGGLLSRMGLVFKSLTRAIPLLAGAYVINMLTGGKLEKTISSISDKVMKEIGSVFGDSGGGDTGGTTHAEPGEIGDSGGQRPQTRPSVTQQPTVNQPQINQPSASPQGPRTRDVPFNPQTATPSKRIFTNDSSIATDSDLTGITFTPRKNNPDKNIVKGLAQRLQYIRRKLGGKNLYINSGFRTKKHNDDVGGEKNSLHLTGRAVDVSKKSIGSEKDQIAFVKYAVEAGIGGIGFYDTFIHIDIRNRKNGRIARWNVNKFPKEALDIINNPGRYGTNEPISSGSEENNTHKEENENNDSNAGQEKPESSSPTSAPKSTASKIINAVGSAIGSVLGIGDANATQDITKTDSGEGLKMPSGGMQSIQTASKVTSNGYPEKAERLFSEMEQKYKLPKGFLRAIADTETGKISSKNTFEQKAKKRSNKGAMGLMQFMPKTAKQEGLKNPYDPYASIQAAGKYLGVQIRKELKTNDPAILNNPKILAAAYNAGAGNVRKAGYKVPNLTETKNYVAKVASYMGASSTMIADKDSPEQPNKTTTPQTQQPNTADTTTPETQQPNTADTTTPEQQPETDALLEQIKSTLPGAEKIAMFGHDNFLSAALSGSKEDISSGIADFVSNIKNLGDTLRAKVKSSQEQPMPEKNPWTALLEQADPKNLIKETASIQPTPEAVKGEKLNEAVKSVESARTTAMFENNKKDLSPVMTPDPPQVTQKRSDNPPSRSTMGINNMSLRNSDEPIIYKLMVKALDISSVS